MLQSIRDTVQGWIATIIFGLLIVPFAFWGINYYFEGGGEAMAARVNDDPISLRDYQRTLQLVRQRWQDVSGSQPTADQDGLIREQAINSLVDRELMHQIAEAFGVRVGDAQVRAAIRDLEAFHGPNGFDEIIYQTTLSTLSMNATGFEAQMREDMKSDQVQTALFDSSFVTDGEIDRLLGMRNQVRDFRHAVISADQAKQAAQASAEEVEAWYQEHAAEFTEPARVRVAYLDLSQDRIALDVSVTDEALRGWYADNAASFAVQEQRKIRQVLVSVPETATPEQVAAASARADALREQIAGGMPMDQATTGQPEDRNTPIEFTEFGFLNPGVLEPDVDAAAFALKTAEISRPVRSKFGFHIVEVTEVRAGSTPAFEEVRGQVEKDYRQAQAERRFAELADQLANLAFEHPDSLEEAAEALSLPIRESEFFSREAPGPEIFASQKVIDVAFSEDVLQGRLNSEAVEVEPGRLVVLRLLEHVPARQTPLDGVRDRIVTRLKFDKGRAQVEESGRAAILELQQGADPEAVAGKYGFTWNEARGVRRDAPDVNRAIVRAAFRAGTPAAGATVFDGVSLGTGDYAIIGVSSVTNPDPAAISDAERAAARKELLGQTAFRSWSRFLASSKSKADVQIFRDNLQ